MVHFPALVEFPVLVHFPPPLKVWYVIACPQCQKQHILILSLKCNSQQERVRQRHLQGVIECHPRGLNDFAVVAWPVWLSRFSQVCQHYLNLVWRFGEITGVVEPVVDVELNPSCSPKPSLVLNYSIVSEVTSSEHTEPTSCDDVISSESPRSLIDVNLTCIGNSCT